MLSACGDDAVTPTLLGERETYDGPVQLTLTTATGRTALRGDLQWDRGEGLAVWQDAGGSRRMRLRLDGSSGSVATLEVEGREVPLDAVGQQELFALSALLFQRPRTSAEVVPLEGGVDGYRIEEGARSLEVRIGRPD